MSISEKLILKIFRKFYMQPGKMLCFSGMDLASKQGALDSLVDKQLLIREKVSGAFSLTSSGYVQMRRAT
ncbi:hypothetical protein [Blastopirellula marina]|uniref:ArnR1-like winged helix-turn-helix domain-containing protein n=1 Tax=Blastopirellula marina TaxID=124 RepID=A0A2S8GQX0_9BACT|nr:hypothetical protein [Blastopirellula marina]PQO46823.1 hypothetical protein C5Y93_06635 [Blastopirellula marina]